MSVGRCGSEPCAFDLLALHEVDEGRQNVDEGNSLE